MYHGHFACAFLKEIMKNEKREKGVQCLNVHKEMRQSFWTMSLFSFCYKIGVHTEERLQNSETGAFLDEEIHDYRTMANIPTLGAVMIVAEFFNWCLFRMLQF